MQQPFKEDVELVLKCLAGDVNAFEPLVRRYQNAAYAIAMGYVQERADAQDIVQEAFIKAFCKLGQLRDPALFGIWFKRIVETCAKESLRRRHFSRGFVYPMQVVEQDLARKAELDHQDRSEKTDIWDAVDKLPEHLRSAALMHYFSGMTYDEIATFLDVPVSTVRGRLQQSRIRLRKTLLPIEREEIEMEKIDIAKEVQDAVCQIATEQVREVVPLGDMSHIVLYCGVDADIEVRETEGEDVIIEGTKTSIGFSDEEARASVEQIEILVDQVEDYLKEGPHKGQIFIGTNSSGEKAVGVSGGTEKVWKAHVDDIWHEPDREANGVKVVDLYPFLEDHVDGFPKEIQEALVKAIRISVIRKEMEDIVLLRKAITPEIEKIFKPNWSSDERLHGPVGHVSLAISIPASKTLTIIRGQNIQVSGLHGSINFIQSYGVELTDIVGDVYLFGSQLNTARRIRGKIYQRFYQFGGKNTVDFHIKRNQGWECNIEDVEGDVDVDVGCTNIETARLSGKVRIYNRYGTTRLYQGEFKPDSRFHIETCSGEILLFLKEDLIGLVHLAIHTICGEIKCDPLKVLGGLNTSNNPYKISLSTNRKATGRDVLDADICIQTENGAVTIEKMK